MFSVARRVQPERGAVCARDHDRVGEARPQHREALLSLQPDALFDDMRELLQFVRNEKAGGKEY